MYNFEIMKLKCLISKFMSLTINKTRFRYMFQFIYLCENLAKQNNSKEILSVSFSRDLIKK